MWDQIRTLALNHAVSKSIHFELAVFWPLVDLQRNMSHDL